MLKKKKLWSLIGAVLLVAACGGGGGSKNTDPTLGSGGSADDGSGNNPPPSDNPPGNNPPDNQVADQQLSGNLQLVANQLPYINEDRSLEYGIAPYDAGQVEWFEEGWPDENNVRHIMRIATGGTASDDNKPVRPEAYAPAAPIASIGFRVAFQTINNSDTSQTGAQTAIGRVAFQFIESPDSQYIQPGQSAERMSFVIDKVELSTDASGRLVSAKVLEGAQMHVSAVTATGTPINESIPVPANSVQLMSMTRVIDHENDESSVVLLLNLEQAFSQADAKLVALHNLQGLFDVDITISPIAKIVRPVGTNLLRRELIGKSIQVGNQPPVNGAGVSIKLLVRAL